MDRIEWTCRFRETLVDCPNPQRLAEILYDSVLGTLYLTSEELKLMNKHETPATREIMRQLLNEVYN